jgi:hypothetical protein
MATQLAKIAAAVWAIPGWAVATKAAPVAAAT